MRMRDIARALGVSTMTVSRALKADASVAPATREAVLAAIADLGYVPNQIAGGLSSSKSGFVAVLVPSLNNPHFSATVQALSDVLEPHGLQLLLGYTGYDKAREEALVRAMLGRKPEAVVLTSDGHSQKTEMMLARARIPIIEIWDIPARPIGHVVGFSNREAMRCHVQALINAGYRRITYLGESQDAGTRGAARRQGFLDAITHNNLGTARQCTIDSLPVTMSHGETGLSQVLEAFPDTDLIVCVSDPLAFGVLSACQDRGIRVPQDMAVAGFGDFEISRISRPRISTLAIDAYRIGKEAAETLVHLKGTGADGALEQSAMRLIPVVSELRASAPGVQKAGASGEPYSRTPGA